jgi:hypothetical protein
MKKVIACLPISTRSHQQNCPQITNNQKNNYQLRLLFEVEGEIWSIFSGKAVDYVKVPARLSS